jgi:hypothetical protein
MLGASRPLRLLAVGVMTLRGILRSWEGWFGSSWEMEEARDGDDA